MRKKQEDIEKSLPTCLRVSLGSAVVLELLEAKLHSAPTTAYLMTYRKGKCTANCSFCPQARLSRGRADLLSRVSWPVFNTKDVLAGLEKPVRQGVIKRVCLQALNFPEVFTHLATLVATISQEIGVPVSVSCQPMNGENIRQLAQAGAERIGIPLDAATEALFEKVKGSFVDGPYSWRKQFELLREAVDVFGKGNVSTHFIVGLGETEKEMANAIQKCSDIGVLSALFAFTPIAGTALEKMTQPPIPTYRRIQLARHVILNRMARSEDMSFNSEDQLTNYGIETNVLASIVRSGEPFRTSGCPDCNRPYYNEKPGGPIYNYPRLLMANELSEVKRELNLAEE
ncbi:MAG TPA: radical SAM protein [Candidatus Bathyarchaeia archaeon]|jgi:biotin synthase|nr:radical SAM protein [Candidatus Bathyarchaeia archaeon]